MTSLAFGMIFDHSTYLKNLNNCYLFFVTYFIFKLTIGQTLIQKLTALFIKKRRWYSLRKKKPNLVLDEIDVSHLSV